MPCQTKPGRHVLRKEGSKDHTGKRFRVSVAVVSRCRSEQNSKGGQLISANSRRLLSRTIDREYTYQKTCAVLLSPQVLLITTFVVALLEKDGISQPNSQRLEIRRLSTTATDLLVLPHVPIRRPHLCLGLNLWCSNTSSVA